MNRTEMADEYGMTLGEIFGLKRRDPVGFFLSATFGGPDGIVRPAGLTDPLQDREEMPHREVFPLDAVPVVSYTASAPQRLSASAPQRLSASAPQRLSASAPQRLSASAPQRLDNGFAIMRRREMTDIIEPHDPPGATIQSADRRPWKAPRLIDLDELDAEACRGGVGGDFKQQAMVEATSVGKCSFRGNPTRLIAS